MVEAGGEFGFFKPDYLAEFPGLDPILLNGPGEARSP